MTDIISTLRDDTRFNYSDVVRKIQQEDNSVPHHAHLHNTVELFAFGNYPHYVKYQPHFIDLDKTLLLKLIKLTILAMCSENEGKVILVEDMEREYGLESAIHHYTQVANSSTEVGQYQFSNDCHLLESILFSMIDDSLINIKIDDTCKLIRVVKSFKLRDSYNRNDVKLLVLKEEDIPRNAGTSYAKLEKWLNENVKPAQTEYGTNLKKFNEKNIMNQN